MSFLTFHPVSSFFALDTYWLCSLVAWARFFKKAQEKRAAGGAVVAEDFLLYLSTSVVRAKNFLAALEHVTHVTSVLYRKLKKHMNIIYYVFSLSGNDVFSMLM